MFLGTLCMNNGSFNKLEYLKKSVKNNTVDLKLYVLELKMHKF